jgi:hypothetical protein
MPQKTEPDPQPPPPKSATEDMLSYIASFEIKLPKLSLGGLTSAAFEHFNAQLKGQGQPSAEEIAKRFTSNGICSPKEQASNARRQKDWIARRQVEYLRSQIASANPDLTELAAKTRSRDVREAVIYKIYRTIGDSYPGLAQAASEARIRKTRELNAINQEPEPLPPEPEPEAPTVTQAEASNADVELVRRQATQVVNAMLICLQEVHEHLLPEAAKFGVVLDAQAEHAWSMSAWIELARGSKAHWKMPTDRREAAK